MSWNASDRQRMIEKNFALEKENAALKQQLKNTQAVLETTNLANNAVSDVNSILKQQLAESEAARDELEKKYQRSLIKLVQDGCYCPLDKITHCQKCEHWDTITEEGINGCKFNEKNFDAYFSDGSKFDKEGKLI